MAIYSISDLEKLSGIKAHTIRIWEKRYNLLEPRRTPTNIRYYIETDLKKLLNIALLNRNGFKISKIAQMEPDQIREAILAISHEEENDQDLLSDALTIAMLDMDEEKFNAVVQSNINELGFKRTMIEVIFPFLNRLGVLWMTGSISPVQENYVAGLIKQKIFVAIDNLKVKPDKATFIIYLPEGERQELSLLFIHYVLREAGYRVVNLGVHSSLDDVKRAYQIQSAQYILTIINEPMMGMSLLDYIDQLSLHFRQSTLLLSGLQLARRGVKSKRNYRVFDDLSSLHQFIEAN